MSQYNEQEIIEKYFGTTIGSLIDIGANNGIKCSNSRFLVEKGWRAVLVEADPNTYLHLHANCKDFPNACCIWAAMSNRYGVSRFGRHDEKCSGLSYLEGEGAGWIPTQVPIMTLASLAWFGRPDFITIDAEGHDLRIIQTMPEGMQPRLLIAETDKGDGAQIDAEMNQRGYAILFKNKGNTGYVI